MTRTTFRLSLKAMTQAFNTDIAGQNMYGFTGEAAKEYLPHHVTENEYLERLDPAELRDVLHKIGYSLIRRKSFDGAKFNKEWVVIVDGTQGYSGSRKMRDRRRFCGDELLKYHTSSNVQSRGKVMQTMLV